jgi:hypothetical protein
MASASDDSKDFEPKPDPQVLTQDPNPENNSSTGVNYEPEPAKSIRVSPERERIVKSITSLYSGSANVDDMAVYSEDAIYDDPWR